MAIITVNLDKAKEVKREMLRAERAPLLQKLDVQFQRALEDGGDTSAIVAKKQALRDAPTLVDSATTLDAIKAVTLPDVGV